MAGILLAEEEWSQVFFVGSQRYQPLDSIHVFQDDLLELV